MQSACGKAKIDVKLRRALLRRRTVKDEELLPGERRYYWRDFPDKAHTIRWRGPAVVVAQLSATLTLAPSPCTGLHMEQSSFALEFNMFVRW